MDPDSPSWMVLLWCNRCAMRITTLYDLQSGPFSAALVTAVMHEHDTEVHLDPLRLSPWPPPTP